MSDTMRNRSYQLSPSYGGTITLALADSVARTVELDAQVRGLMDSIQALGLQLQPDADRNAMAMPVIWWSDIETEQTFEQIYPAQQA